jgi:PAS domain S-box-containing protein
MALSDDVALLESLSRKLGWDHELNFSKAIFNESKTILLTDDKFQIMFASSSLYQMNGYMPSEVIGKAPKMFQGRNTSSESLAPIRSGIQKLVPFEAEVINYRKNGTEYNCHIKAYPLFNRQNEIVNFIAFEHAA